MEQKKIESLKNTIDLTNLRNKLEEIQKTPQTRTVILKYSSCCGCGCDDVDIKREVPYDSELKDGDRIGSDEVLATDKIVD